MSSPLRAIAFDMDGTLFTGLLSSKQIAELKTSQDARGWVQKYVPSAEAFRSFVYWAQSEGIRVAIASNNASWTGILWLLAAIFEPDATDRSNREEHHAIPRYRSIPRNPIEPLVLRIKANPEDAGVNSKVIMLEQLTGERDGPGVSPQHDRLPSFSFAERPLDRDQVLLVDDSRENVDAVQSAGFQGMFVRAPLTEGDIAAIKERFT